MACACGGTKNRTSWVHVAPNGTRTVKRRKYEAEWLLKKHGGSIEPLERPR